MGYITNLQSLFDSHHVVLSIRDHSIARSDSLEQKNTQLIDGLRKQNLTTKRY